MSRKIDRWWHQWTIAADEVRTRMSESFRSSPGARLAPRPPRLSSLEPRLLFSATPIDMAGLSASDTTAMVVAIEANEAQGESNSIEVLAQNSSVEQIARELVFVDASAPDLQRLLDDLSRSDRNIEVFMLDSGRDGIDQITEVLDGRSDLDSIHIVSHASRGSIKLGNLWLSELDLDGYAGQIASWQSSLSVDADILLYGCDLAGDEEGLALIESLAALTGADVAASDDTTGHSSYGGDWELEYSTGVVDTQVAFSAELQSSWLGKLVIFNVTTTDDIGLGSLRQAIEDANSSTGADIIEFHISGTGIHTIAPTSALPEITEAVTIDATTDDSYVANGNRPAIILSGFNAIAGTDGLVLSSTADFSVIRGLVIRDWGGTGIVIQADSDHNVITGNYIGRLDTSGAEAGLGTENGGDGILILGANNRVGGLTTDDRNIISGNGGNGIVLSGILATQNEVQGNFIGTDVVGIVEIGNGASGVLLQDGATNNVIGGITASESNVIAHNASAGIRVLTDASQNAFLGNSIYGNTGLGINLGTDAVTANDSEDADVGPNEWMNFPVITSVVQNGADVDVTFSADLIAGTYRIEFFENPNGGDISGYGEGKTYLGAITITATGAAGSEFFAGSLTGVTVATSSDVAATATLDSGGGLFGSTSEFSAHYSVAAELAPKNESLINQFTLPDGTQMTSGANRGSQDAVAMDANGNYVVVWTSNQSTGADGLGMGVLARLFDRNGNALTPEFQINTVTVGDQKSARVVRALDGSFVVTWTSGAVGNEDVYFRRFAADGTALDAVDQRANFTLTNTQKNSVIAMDRTTKEFVVAWQGEGPGDSASIFFRRFNSDGTAKDGADRLADAAGVANEQDPAIAMQLNGEFVIAWERADTNKIYFQRFSGTTGNGIGSSTQIDFSLSNSSAVDVATDDAGNFTFVYRENGIAPGVYRRAYFADGSDRYNPVFPWTQLSGGEPDSASISMLSDGSHIVTWQKNDGNGIGIYERRYFSDGNANGSEVLVNYTTIGQQSQSSVAALDINNFVVVWSGEGTIDTTGVYAKQFGTGSAINADPGANAGGPYTINEGGSLNLNGAASVDPDGNALSYAWDLDNDGIYGEVGEPTTVSPTVDWATLVGFGIDDQGVYSIGVQVNDGNGGITSSLATVTVNNTVPTLSVTGASTVVSGSNYTLHLSAVDPGNDTISNWEVNWGDGNVENFAGSLASVTHVYAASGSTYSVSVSATDEDGTFATTGPNVTVIAPPNGGQFWFSTTGAGSASSLPNWGNGTVIELGGSTLSFEPSGSPANTTSGDFTPAFDVGNFAAGADVNALHYVGTNLTIGGNAFPAFDLLIGDVLVSTRSDHTLTSTNTLSVKKEDVFVFRPDAIGNYSSGTFYLLLEDPAGAEIRGISLVEQTTTLPDTTLAAGTFLYSRSGPSQDSNIYVYTASDVGVGKTIGSSQLLIDGADVGISDKIIGIELIETPITVAGTSFAGGQILLAIDANASVGDNSLNVKREDVFALSLSQTTLGSGIAHGSAILIVDGNDIELSGNNESIDAIALFNRNVSPTNISISSSSVDEGIDTTGGYNVGVLTASDADVGEVFTWTVVGGADLARFSVGGASANELRLNDGVLNHATKSSYQVIVRVTDSGGNQYNKTLTIAVNDLTHLPTVVNAIPDQIATQNIPFSFQFNSNTFNDVDGDTLTYTASLAQGSMLPTWLVFDSASRTFSGTPASGNVGVLNIRVTADDGNSGTVYDDFFLTVNNIDDVPVGINDVYTVNEDSPLNSNGQWFDANWTYRRTLSIDNTGQNENLIGFPLLVKLDASRIDYSKTMNAGEDLRFVDGNGNVLAYEIETWNESGTSYVWVNVPQIDQSSPTDFIWMYYGNSSAVDGQNASGVWPPGYKAVYHLHNDFLDSTSNNNDATNFQSVDVVGEFGDAQRFDGINDIITIGSNASVDNLFAGGGSVSAWFNPTGWGGGSYGRIVDKGSGTSPNPNGWDISLDGPNQSLIFEIGFSGSVGRWRIPAGSVTLNTWQSVTVVYDSSSAANNPIIYLNGVAQTVTRSNAPTGTVLSDSGLSLQIGNYASLTRAFAGKIDEVRFVDGTVSADWVRALSIAANDNFVTIGYEQTTAGVLGNDFDADGESLTATLVGGAPANAKTFNFNSDGSFTYTANDNFNGVDTFTYVANDGNGDSALTTVSITVLPTNDAPTIGAGTLTSVSEDTLSPAGDTVASLFGGSFADIDAGSSLSGIVVVGNTANAGTQGAWQYSSNGTDWFDVASADDLGSGLVISAASKIRFLPVLNYSGTPTALTVRGLDNSYSGNFSTTVSVQVRRIVDTSSPTATSAFSVATSTLGTTVTDVNDLPIIGGTADGAISDKQNTQPFGGVTIIDIEGDSVTVAVSLNGGDLNGVFSAASLTASGFTKIGAGQYTLGSSTTIAAQSAIRQLVFVPTENQVASGSTVVTTFTITVSDIGPAVSDNTTDVTTTSINNSPTLAAGNLPDTAEDDLLPSGATVASIFAGKFTDADDASSLSGIVVVGNSTNPIMEGVWQYSSNGTDWNSIGSVDDSSNGLAIAAGSKIRFVPILNYNGSPTSLVVRGLDDSYDGAFSTTSGSESRQVVNTDSPGPTSALSNSMTLGIYVTPNVPPTVNGTVGGQAVNDNQTISPFAAVSIGDTEGDNVTVIITLSGGDSNGTFTAASLTASGFSKTAAGEYTRALGTTSSAQAAIRGLVFDPTENQVAVGSTATTTFTISVTDDVSTTDSNTTVVALSINDAPTNISLDNANVSENDDGAIVGNVAATDSDLGDSHVWSVDDTRFEFVGNQLKLKTGNSLNRESESTISLSVTTIDQSGAGLSYNETIVITVNNVNEIATDITLDNSSVVENLSGGVIGNVGVLDPDDGDTHIWTVDDARFEIVGNQLKLRAGEMLDQEAEAMVSLLVTAIDQAGLGIAYSKSFSIVVDDINENPTGISLSSNNARSGVAGATVAVVTTTDPDDGDLHTWTVDDARFTIVGGVLKLKPTQSLDARLEPSITLTITATDLGGLTFVETFIVAVDLPAFNPSAGGGTTTQDSNSTPEPTDSDRNADTTDDSDTTDDGDGATAEAKLNIPQGTPSSDEGNPTPSSPTINVLGILSEIGDEDSNSSSEAFANVLQVVNQFGFGSGDSLSGDSMSDSSTSGNQQRLGYGGSITGSTQANYALMTRPGLMWNELDKQLSHVESQIQGDLIVVGAAGAAASSFTVGIVAWGLRTGFLASGLLAQMPAWRAIDPLLIMQGTGEGDNESLEELMKRRSDALDELHEPDHVTE